MVGKYKILLLSVGSLVAALLVMIFWNGNHSEEERKSSPVLKRAGPDEPKLSGNLLVNGTTAVRIDSNTAVWIEFRLFNSGEDEVGIDNLKTTKPVVREEGGRELEVSMQLMGEPPQRIVSRGSAVLRWRLKTPLAPGRYEISSPPTPNSENSHHYRPAYLWVLSEPISDEVRKYYSRRRRLLGGQGITVLEELQAAILAQPANPLLRKEYLSTLEEIGDVDGIHTSLSEIISEFQKSGEPLPDWVVHRLERMQIQ